MKQFIKEYREKDKKGSKEIEEMDKLLERRWRFLVKNKKCALLYKGPSPKKKP